MTLIIVPNTATPNQALLARIADLTAGGGEGEVGLSSEEVEVIVVALGLLGLRVPSELQAVRVFYGGQQDQLGVGIRFRIRGA